ncbi:MAG: class I SAM-dependent methyltransferase [Acholeplasmataceae bacterium]|nr:class I SAM-dependent methyltransferase [Acholeplasmataceae bacterium]
MRALQQINKFLSGNMQILKDEKWLKYLALTDEKNINYERINKLSDISVNYNLLYVKKSLELLESLDLTINTKVILEEVLKWSEVAKTGNIYFRNKWIESGYNLYAHNVGSSQIYNKDAIPENDNRKLITTLIETHGLIGQYLRGEVPLYSNEPLYKLLLNNDITKELLSELVLNLNYCIIGAISIELWESLRESISNTVIMIINGDFSHGMTIKERVRSLRKSSIENGERFDELWDEIELDPEKIQIFQDIFSKHELWYVEAALHDFTFEEFTKIFALLYYGAKEEVHQISFEKMMKDIHYDHKGIKKVNIYKKRIIEKYLQDLSLDDIANCTIKQNIHVKHILQFGKNDTSTIFFEFEYSATSSKLIEFCEIAETSDKLYEKAVIMLFDLFHLRKDNFDRFYNEEEYLETMNKSVKHKAVILDYIVGNDVVDIGPGGGALMDMIEESNPKLKIVGLDFSQSVIENLTKKKKLENRIWNVLYGDALCMSRYIPKESQDTIIFSSIIHELYSYIEYNGKKFNHQVIKDVLKSAFDVLRIGGRIIIRDGIMSEPKEQIRIIKFRTDEGLQFLRNYARDFSGREIKYKIINHNEVQMEINDAMEFLYTYTWGEDSYVHEVNEQFGYFTPLEYKAFIHESLGVKAKILKCDHYLQDGYATALSPKVEFYDEKHMLTKLPDSTCLIVIEK